MDKFKKVKVIGNVIGYNRYALSKKETYNVQFPDMTIAELKRYQFEDADAYHTDGKRLCLRNVLARLHELPEHDRGVWLKGIMDEFELGFSHAKWREGYAQGKFDGAIEREKVVVPQFVADIIEYYKKKNAPIVDVFTEKNTDKKYAWWLATDFNAYDRVARAWLDGYEVEREKLYTVELPNPNGKSPIRKCGLVKNADQNAVIGFSERLHQFTESEIRKDFEWAWQFAKEAANE